MRFSRHHKAEEPEINLIPFIDVLLVIIIFLMLTTTYSRFSALEINLPTADAPKQDKEPEEINVSITSGGKISVNQASISPVDVATIAQALQQAAGRANPVIIINADAQSAHQNVIDVMQAAQQAGLTHISFATQPAKETVTGR